jgi:hypothetical protein
MIFVRYSMNQYCLQKYIQNKLRLFQNRNKYFKYTLLNLGLSIFR